MSRYHISKFLCATLLFAGYAPQCQAQPDTKAAVFYPQLSIEALNAQIGGPTKITIHVQDASLTDVLTQISQQTDVKLATFPGAPENTNKITLDADAKPFWDVFRDLASQAKTPINILRKNGDAGELNGLYFGDYRLSGVPSESGPILLLANQIQKTSTKTTVVSLGARPKATVTRVPQESNRMQVGMNLLLDPKLWLKQGDFDIRIESAVDENGQNLKSTDNRPFYRMRESAIIRNISQQLNLPPNVGNQIARMRGAITMYLPRQTEKWEINDFTAAKGTSKTISSNGQSFTYTIESIAQVQDTYYIGLKIEGENIAEAAGIMITPDNDLRKQKGRLPTLKYFDGSGAELSSGGGATSSSGNVMTMQTSVSKRRTALQGEAQPPQTGDAPKLIIEIPHDFAQINFPFEFTNLPLQ